MFFTQSTSSIKSIGIITYIIVQLMYFVFCWFVLFWYIIEVIYTTYSLVALTLFAIHNSLFHTIRDSLHILVFHCYTPQSSTTLYLYCQYLSWTHYTLSCPHFLSTDIKTISILHPHAINTPHSPYIYYISAILPIHCYYPVLHVHVHIHMI